ncbi:hypothetical protein ZWY2020_045975 [Hordeum vulgare]|nr:hypothetical protein ZWY2020_045975 [Hordeum vulgare]
MLRRRAARRRITLPDSHIPESVSLAHTLLSRPCVSTLQVQGPAGRERQSRCQTLFLLPPRGADPWAAEPRHRVAATSAPESSTAAAYLAFPSLFRSAKLRKSCPRPTRLGPRSASSPSHRSDASRPSCVALSCKTVSGQTKIDEEVMSMRATGGAVSYHTEASLSIDLRVI